MPLPPRCRGGERRRYREAVLGGPAPSGAAEPGPRRRPRVLAGTVIDASPHLLVLRDATGAADTSGPGGGGSGGSGGEVRLPLTSSTSIWYGGRGGVAALRPGREVIVRCAPDGLGADRIWVDIGRVTGTILACGRDTVEVDMGPHRGRAQVVIPPRARGRVLVRHPRLEPGYLIDVICVRSASGPQAVRPGTSQPGHRASDLAEPEPDAPVPETLRGTATWFGGATYEAPAARTTSEPSWSGGGGRHPGGAADADPYAAPGSPASGLRLGPSPDAEGPPHIDGTAFAPPGGPSGDEAPFRPASSVAGGGAVPRHAASRRRRGRATSARSARAARSERSAGRRPGPGAPETPRPDVRAAAPEFRLGGSAGVAYPALDPEGEGGGCPTAPPPGCAPLPYLSLGSRVVVRNECSGLAAALPVIECGCVAAGYCDRCVECDTSPRGRLVELTPAAFVGLGGDLAAGCFTTVLRHDAPGAGAGG